MSEVVMYSTRFCPYCVSAERLLSSKGVNIRTIPVGSDQDLWEEMQELTGRNTVPQIFIGDHYVGGYDDLALLERDGELDPLLEPILNESKARG
ncbi:Glutaredoxin 3 (Grx3) [hydrothermal vent metagenome]|uniref:Glutaredoxin 3 (Grx3) n=1 Tax=hydrothermal vent metagenome TaxID=652676 RepID=A0A3B0XYJ4_9ZZZZ